MSTENLILLLIGLLITVHSAILGAIWVRLTRLDTSVAEVREHWITRREVSEQLTGIIAKMDAQNEAATRYRHDIRNQLLGMSGTLATLTERHRDER